VPVIRNVEEMNYADIEKAINAMGEKVCKRFNHQILENRFFGSGLNSRHLLGPGRVPPREERGLIQRLVIEPSSSGPFVKRPGFRHHHLLVPILLMTRPFS